jgi:hypothetical protein
VIEHSIESKVESFKVYLDRSRDQIIERLENYAEELRQYNNLLFKLNLKLFWYFLAPNLI